MRAGGAHSCGCSALTVVEWFHDHLALTIRAATLNLRRLCNLGLHWHDGWNLAT